MRSVRVVSKHGTEHKGAPERVEAHKPVEKPKVESKHEGGSVETTVEVGTPYVPRTKLGDKRYE